MKRDTKTALLFGLILLGGALLAMNAPKIASLIRGIRNHNPGNIVRTGIKWQGMAADQSSDPRFVVFTSAEYGIRALARVLRNYIAQGYNTVQSIIARYAPASENDTKSYVNAVAQSLGVSPNQPLNFDQSKTALVNAIIRHENGINPYSADTIARGIQIELSS